MDLNTESSSLDLFENFAENEYLVMADSKNFDNVPTGYSSFPRRSKNDFDSNLLSYQVEEFDFYDKKMDYN